MEQFKMIAKTFEGLEEVLANELTALGAEDVTTGRRMVAFRGDKAMMYRANFSLRTALRILKPIKTFTANNPDEVYEAVSTIEWSQYLDLKNTFAVDAVVYSETFRHSKFVSYKVKDAIVDYFYRTVGKRPNISVASPDIKLNIHIAENECTLSLDSSGESLHKRGYRVGSVESPINEVLAAGMLMLTGWQADCDLIDPMCGSGTIAIEAALMARNIAPGIFRTKYGFENWHDFEPELLDSIYNDDSAEREFTHKIYAYDIDKNAIAVATENAKAAGVNKCITFDARPIQQFTQPEEKALVIMNPPYGERISSPNILNLYKTIGEKLKHQLVGGEAWIISYRRETFDQIGLKPSLKIPLFNGSLDCEFRKYQIFDGKLSSFREAEGILKTDEERARNAAKRKLKPRREFDSLYEPQRNEPSEEEGEIPAYLLKRHREFVKSHRSDYASPRRDNSDRPRRNNSDRPRRDNNDRPRRQGKPSHGPRRSDASYFKRTSNKHHYDDNE